MACLLPSTRQLGQLLELYDAEHIAQHLVPVAFTLTEDGVATVRQMALKVVSKWKCTPLNIEMCSYCDSKA